MTILCAWRGHSLPSETLHYFQQKEERSFPSGRSGSPSGFSFESQFSERIDGFLKSYYVTGVLCHTRVISPIGGVRCYIACPFSLLWRCCS